MTFQLTDEDVPLQDAATVMLVRDGNEGLEVFMLRRNLDSDFVGGAYVFPGGAVDHEDGQSDVEDLCQGRSDHDASAFLGLDSGGLAFWVAAIRESFEEAGVLLAYDRDGDVIHLDDPTTAERFRTHREEVDQSRRRLLDVCRDERLVLAVDQMYYFSNWITPEGAPRRYDTRFFVAAAPNGQTPLEDGVETIAHLWITPAEALARNRAGEFELIFPTIRSLEAIGRFDSAAELLDAAAHITNVPAILPRIISEEGGFRIVLPGDGEFDALTGQPVGDR